MKKKVIIGIVIAVVVLLAIIIGYGEVTGKFSLFGRKVRSGSTVFCALTYPSFDVIGKEGQGTLAGDAEWKSISYTFNTNQTITIYRYRNVSIDTIMEDRDRYEDVEINGMHYKHLETSLDSDGFVLDQYYADGRTNTYYFSSVYKDTQTNRERFEDLLHDVQYGTEPEDVEPEP